MACGFSGERSSGFLLTGVLIFGWAVADKCSMRLALHCSFTQATNFAAVASLHAQGLRRIKVLGHLVVHRYKPRLFFLFRFYTGR